MRGVFVAVGEIDGDPDSHPDYEAQPRDKRKAEHKGETTDDPKIRHDGDEGAAESARLIRFVFAKCCDAGADKNKCSKCADIGELSRLTDVDKER